MGFGSYEKQQRLSFTSLTYEKILFDMEIFNENKFATYINRVINNYYPYAKSSIQIQLDNEKERLINILTNDNREFNPSVLSPNAKDTVISALLNEKKNELYKYKETLLSGNRIENKKIYLSSDILDYLTDASCQEVIHYSRKEYIECLIEEFVNLPLPEKEYYYYIDRIHIINEAISGGYQLKIKTINGNTIYIKPYKLDSYNGSSNYLIGYSVYTEINGLKEYAACYRISTLQEIKPIRSRSGRFSKEKIDILNKRIALNGAQFFSEDTEQIVVHFNENGFKKYLRTSHLRPQYDTTSEMFSRNEGIYVFNCTPTQAEYYFLRLGSDVEILKPKYLRDKFSSIFRRANEIYND